MQEYEKFEETEGETGVPEETLEESAQEEEDVARRPARKVTAAEKATEAVGKRARKTSEAAGKKAKELAGTAAGKIREFGQSPEVRSIEPLTWVGLGVTFLFLVFMPFDWLNLRWWLMLPLGTAGVVVLWVQWASARNEKVFEARVCLAGLIVLLALMLFRDALLSSSLLEIYDKTSALDSTLEEVNKALGK